MTGEAPAALANVVLRPSFQRKLESMVRGQQAIATTGPERDVGASVQAALLFTGRGAKRDPSLLESMVGGQQAIAANRARPR